MFDRVILAVPPGAPPRVVALEVAPAVLAARLRPVLRRWVAAVERACGVDEGYVASWDQLDITDPDRARLTCSLASLRRL
jgi:hypothetical protein